ncbi:hypothetical protein ACSBR2_009634 [Camellia fascicularis]
MLLSFDYAHLTSLSAGNLSYAGLPTNSKRISASLSDVYPCIQLDIVMLFSHGCKFWHEHFDDPGRIEWQGFP